jgi:hypothetical protein
MRGRARCDAQDTVDKGFTHGNKEEDVAVVVGIWTTRYLKGFAPEMLVEKVAWFVATVGQGSVLVDESIQRNNMLTDWLRNKILSNMTQNVN